MAHITLSQLTTVLQRIVSWAGGKFAAKNTYSGKLEYADMPVVVLASMGSELDGTSTQRPMSAGSTYFLPAEQGTSARIMFVTALGQPVKISDPDSGVIYCNAYTGLLYRWDSTTSQMVSVGGGGDGLRKVYVNITSSTPDFSNLNALHSAETSGVYQVIDQSSQKIIGILVVSSDNNPYLVTQWLFSTLVLSDEFSGSLTGAEYTYGRAHIIHRFYNVSNTSYSDVPLNTWGEWKVYGLTLDEMSEIFNSKVSTISVNGGTPAQPDTNGNVNLVVQAGAQGPKGDKGDTVVIDPQGLPQFTIVNDLVSGGEADALSAEMGKRVAGREATDRQRIDAIVDILKKSVFTDDQAAAFAALDALANGIDSISFSVSSHKFTHIGDTFTLSIVTDPAGKTAQVTWATNNASVATVNNGVVTAVADGATTITATTSDGKVAVCNIEVETIVITGLSLNKSTLTLNGNDANETLIATTVPTGYESGVQWSSSNPTKATVDNNGKVIAVANGTATITASIGGQTATCQVTVTGVMQTFHVNVGTLSNVTLEDGQGNSITNGQSVLEGSLLTIKLVPASSHQIDSASVTMGGVAQTLTDGTGGSKSVALTVSGDIAVSASATFNPINLANADYFLQGQGVRSSGAISATADIDCYMIPIEAGKRYIVFGYSGVSGGAANRFALGTVENGSFRCLTANDFVSNPSFYTQNSLFTSGSCLKITDNYLFDVKTPLIADLVNPSIQLYLGINTGWRGNSPFDVSSTIEIYECPFAIGYYSRLNSLWKLGTRSSKALEMNDSIVSAAIKLDKGATYDFSGYVRSVGGTSVAYCDFAILKTNNGGMTFEKLTSADITGNYTSDFFTVDTSGVIAQNVGENGTFTVPSASALGSGVGDLFLIIKMKFSDTLIIDDTNLVIEKQ